MTDLTPKIKDILNNGMDVLVYSGDKDFICNWRGGEAWTQNQDWDSAADFKAATYNSWNNGAGQLKMAKNFKFLRVLNAGHMVPMNQPSAALQMLTDFTSGTLKGEPVSLPEEPFFL